MNKLSKKKKKLKDLNILECYPRVSDINFLILNIIERGLPARHPPPCEPF